MPSPSARAIIRSQLMRLLAQAFAHPLPGFYQQLVGGEYQKWIAELTEPLFGNAHQVNSSGFNFSDHCFSDYEAQFIDLFQMGKHGQPVVPLNAGAYSELLGSERRPEYLLRYSNWYKYFGLEVGQNDETSELPDHLVCQLEFLSWLAHLQSESLDKPELENSYQRAQRDFIQRELMPLLDLLIPALSRESQRHSLSPLFSELGQLVKEVIERTFHEFNSVLGPRVQNIDVTVDESIQGGVEQHHPQHADNLVNIWD